MSDILITIDEFEELIKLRALRELVKTLIDQSFRDKRGYIRAHDETWQSIEKHIEMESVDMSKSEIQPYPWQR